MRQIPGFALGEGSCQHYHKVFGFWQKKLWAVSYLLLKKYFKNVFRSQSWGKFSFDIRESFQQSFDWWDFTCTFALSGAQSRGSNIILFFIFTQSPNLPACVRGFLLSWFDMSSVHPSHTELPGKPRCHKALSTRWPNDQVGQTEVFEQTVSPLTLVNSVEEKFWIQRKIRRCAPCLPGHQLTSRTHIAIV